MLFHEMAQTALELKNRPQRAGFFSTPGETRAGEASDRRLIHLTRSDRVIEKGDPKDHLLWGILLTEQGRRLSLLNFPADLSLPADTVATRLRAVNYDLCAR
jgi:hypothetical protein